MVHWLDHSKHASFSVYFTTSIFIVLNISDVFVEAKDKYPSRHRDGVFPYASWNDDWTRGDEDDDEDDGLNGGIIALIVIGSLAGVLGIVLLIYYACRAYCPCSSDKTSNTNTAPASTPPPTTIYATAPKEVDLLESENASHIIPGQYQNTYPRQQYQVESYQNPIEFQEPPPPYSLVEENYAAQQFNGISKTGP